jgi:hypothetical protein
MITIKRSIAILSLLVLLTPVFIFAQTSPAPLVCDPLPTDPDDLLECNLYNFPTGTNYAPGTNPSTPVNFPFSGTHGISAAFNSQTNQLLVVGHNTQGDNIMGTLADPNTMQPIGQPFRIDQGNLFSGEPIAIYNSELNQFLVVWEDSRPCGERCRSSYGRFVSGSGVPQGSDFAITTSAAFLSGLAYDSTNDRYVTVYDAQGAGISLRTISNTGTVSSNVPVLSSYPYQGQTSVAVNTNTNEYWVASAVVVSGNDSTVEDDRIMLTRINAATNTVVGEPIQLSTTRPGRNLIADANIAYSTQGGGAIVTWLERGRDGAIAGVYGRTIYDDGTMSAEYPIITPQTNSFSSGFENPVINYSAATNSFYVSTSDWDGNVWITEIDLTGLVYSSELAIVANITSTASGSFNPTSVPTSNGSATFASSNFANVVGTTRVSTNAIETTPPPPPSENPPPLPPDVTTLPTLINQIYVWSLGIAVLLALLMAILGGYYYMTSAGNAEQSSKGKEYITSALIGLVIIFTAYLLLNQINPQLVNFNLESLGGLRRP